MNFRAQLIATVETQIAPDLFAAASGMEPDRLAKIAGIDASALTQTPYDARLQTYLQIAVRMITSGRGHIAYKPESADQVQIGRHPGFGKLAAEASRGATFRRTGCCVI